MRFLRTVSTRRLLAVLAGLIIAIAGGTAIAVAASSSGPKPPQESLAQALHQAAAAPAVSGITARISFTNNLINSADIQGTDPLLTGAATGRLWLSTTTHQLRLELQGDNGDAQVVVKNGSFWVYDPSSNTVYLGTLPSGGSSSQAKKAVSTEPIPSVAQIQTSLNQLMQHLNIVGPLPRNVAGQPAYKVKITPKHDGGLLGQVQLAWDAAHGVPLGIAIYSSTSSTPVLELKATSISFGSVSKSDFKVSPPPGAKVVKIASMAGSGASASSAQAATAKNHAKHAKNAKSKNAKSNKAHTEVTGAAAVQAHLSFKLNDPGSLDGMSLQSVTLLDWGGTPAALVTYGQGLGGIAVIEQQQSSNTSQSGSQSQSQAGGDHQGLSLPSTTIDGTSAQELETALGTVMHFSKGGVDYTVLGSVPLTAAQIAATTLISGA
jgi:outer membrane lipoprotein-sorting protein